jgi:hypothetical protein
MSPRADCGDGLAGSLLIQQRGEWVNSPRLAVSTRLTSLRACSLLGEQGFHGSVGRCGIRSSGRPAIAPEPVWDDQPFTV